MSRSNKHFDATLVEAASRYGVLLSYRDSKGRLRDSPEAAVRAVVEALAATQAPRRSGLGGHTAEELLPPVILAWEGKLPDVISPLLAANPDWGRPRVTLTLETGEEISRGATSSASYPVSQARLPWGRHILRLELQRGRYEGRSLVGESFVLSAPPRCWAPEEEAGGATAGPRRAGARAAGAGSRVAGVEGRAVRAEIGVATQVTEAEPELAGPAWGIFCPTYALRSERDWGAGDVADLEALAEWVAAWGGSVVATLPLLAPLAASSTGGPWDPSPYRPSSRLFWNDFYLAVDQLPEWEHCPEARQLWQESLRETEWQRLRKLSLVDYRGVAALKKQVLELLAAHFFTQAGDEEKKSFSDYVVSHPLAREFALFQATSLNEARSDQGWGQRNRGLRGADFHLYCQWRMEQQLAGLAEQSKTGLLLDLPLGVHPQGFDAKKWPSLFVEGMSSGAPPDDFFSAGQIWNCPPLHPQADRCQGYAYLSASLATQMRFARYLRLDHVMSLHRLFWVPHGMSAADGVYVTYPSEEMYAVLALESHRHRTLVVGEDLGTVPAGVRTSLRRHRVSRTWVFQSAVHLRRTRFEAEGCGRAREPALAAAEAASLDNSSGSPATASATMQASEPGLVLRVDPVPRGAVVAVNTHDMVPFAGFLRGDDLVLRAEMGGRAARRRLVAALARHFAAAEASPSRAAWASVLCRDPLLARILACLAGSRARLLLVNLEDLWGETEPQNIPGSSHQGRNWRRKVAHPLEELPRPLGAAAAEQDRR